MANFLNSSPTWSHIYILLVEDYDTNSRLVVNEDFIVNSSFKWLTLIVHTHAVRLIKLHVVQLLDTLLLDTQSVDIYILKVIYHPLYGMNTYVLIWGD